MNRVNKQKINIGVGSNVAMIIFKRNTQTGKGMSNAGKSVADSSGKKTPEDNV